MKYIKTFNESQNFTDEENEILVWLGKMGISRNSSINIREGGIVDITGNVGIHSYLRSSFNGKLPIKFGVVTGDFSATFLNLTTLDGCPNRVEGNFHITGSIIGNLVGGPDHVKGEYLADDCQLTSLEGAPKSCLKFICRNNKLVNLIGCPNSPILNFESNLLTSLEGSPEEIGCDLYPVNITPVFHVDKNPTLKNLIGGPKRLGKEFYTFYSLANCGLTSLEGAPEELNGTLRIWGNGNLWDPRGLKDSYVSDLHTKYIKASEPKMWCLQKLFPSIEKFIRSLDYNYIREWEGKPAVVKFRLEEALSDCFEKEIEMNAYNWYRELKGYVILDENLEPCEI